MNWLETLARRHGFGKTVDRFLWDWKRMKARRRSTTMLRAFGPLPDKLQVGSGTRSVPGWMNIDIAGSDVDVDLGAGRLPFPAGAFKTVVSQHVIEHLDIHTEVQPLLKALRRCMVSGGELWLSCPDMAKVCTQYGVDRGVGLLADRRSRTPRFGIKGHPPQQMINYLFHQSGQHRNLFDFELMVFVLERSGFVDVRQVDEAALLARFPEFPRRRDDFVSLYVCARKPGA